MNILLLEDDPALGDVLRYYLSDFYSVKRAFSVKGAVELIEKQSFDIYIFDINLPNKSGLEFLKELRGFRDNTPTIVITAYDDISYLKNAFSSGAFDFLKKPFELEELKVRLDNLISHFNLKRDDIELSKGIFYNRSGRCIKKDNKIVTLKPKEAEILDYFLKNQNRVVSKDELIYNLWEYEEMPTDATLRSYIRNLRNILGGDFLKTKRGVGYIYE